MSNHSKNHSISPASLCRLAFGVFAISASTAAGMTPPTSASNLTGASNSTLPSFQPNPQNRRALMGHHSHSSIIPADLARVTLASNQSAPQEGGEISVYKDSALAHELISIIGFDDGAVKQFIDTFWASNWEKLSFSTRDNDKRQYNSRTRSEVQQAIDANAILHKVPVNKYVEEILTGLTTDQKNELGQIFTPAIQSKNTTQGNITDFKGIAFSTKQGDIPIKFKVDQQTYAVIIATSPKDKPNAVDLITLDHQTLTKSALTLLKALPQNQIADIIQKMQDDMNRAAKRDEKNQKDFEKGLWVIYATFPITIAFAIAYVGKKIYDCHKEGMF
jgi:hypothetical protein